MVFQVVWIPTPAGVNLDLSVSLHNQGILEKEHVSLVHTGEEQISPIRKSSKRISNQKVTEEVR